MKRDGHLHLRVSHEELLAIQRVAGSLSLRVGAAVSLSDAIRHAIAICDLRSAICDQIADEFYEARPKKRKKAGA